MAAVASTATSVAPVVVPKAVRTLPSPRGAGPESIGPWTMGPSHPHAHALAPHVLQNVVPLWAKLVAGGIAGVIGTSIIL